MKVVSLARNTPTGPPLISTKYYQIISNSMGVMACTKFRLQGRYLHNEDSGVVSLACDTFTGPSLHSYQILLKYVLGHQSYGAHKDESTISALGEVTT